MKQYKVEIFFWKDPDNSRHMDLVPTWEDYDEDTKLLEFETWEDPKNEILRKYPGAAFAIIRGIIDIGIHPEEEKAISHYETNILEVRKSHIHGNGVFAKNDIPKASVIFELYGDLVDLSTVDGAYPKGEWNALSSTTFLSRKVRTIYGFINHNRHPNCEINFSNLEIRTLRDLKKGEEITLDYRKESLPSTYLENFGNLYL